MPNTVIVERDQTPTYRDATHDDAEGIAALHADSWRRHYRGALMREAAQRLALRGGRNFYLWVLDQDVAAQQFYATQGGARVETCLRGPFPGGGRALGHRIAWRDLSALLSGS